MSRSERVDGTGGRGSVSRSHARIAHLGEGTHDVSETAGLAEGRALRPDHHHVEALLVGANHEGAARARVGFGLRERDGARGAPEGGREGRATEGRAPGESGGGGGHGCACEVARVVEVTEDESRQSRNESAETGAESRWAFQARFATRPNATLAVDRTRGWFCPEATLAGKKTSGRRGLGCGGEEKPFRGALVSLEVQSNTTPRASNAIP